MAEALGVAGSIIGIAAAGFKVSVSLYTLAETVATASERVESIASDIGSTVGILNQLRDLITPESEHGIHTTVLSSTALSDISTALHHCRQVFDQISRYLKRAAKQIKKHGPRSNAKIELTISEKAKWPFLQPQFTELRNDLRDSKMNLLLMVAVGHFAIAQRGGQLRQVDEQEMEDMKSTIVRLQRAGTRDVQSVVSDADEEDGNVVQRFFRKLRVFSSSPRGDREEKSRSMPNGTKDYRKDTAATATPQETTSKRSRKMEQSLSISNTCGYPPVANVANLSPEAHATTKIPLQNVLSTSSDFGTSPDSQVPLSPRHQKQDETDEEVPDATPSMHDLAGLSAHKDNEITPDLLSTSGRAAAIEIGSDLRPTTTTIPAETTPISQPLEQPYAETTKTLGNEDPVINAQKGLNRKQSSSTLDHVDYEREVASNADLPKDTENSADVRETNSSSDPEDARNGENFTSAEVQKQLRAWTTTIASIMDAKIQSLGIHVDEINSLLKSRMGDCYSLHEALSKLNVFQRHLVLDHVSDNGATLLYVGVWNTEHVYTAYGDIELTLLLWITTAASEKKRRATTIEERRPSSSGGLDTAEVIEDGSFRRTQRHRPEENKPQLIKLVDAIGRKFAFPFELVKTWKGIHQLISQAFEHVVELNQHVAQGHYDIVELSTGAVFLPMLWETMVWPGMEFFIKMWPMPEPPLPPELPKEFPVPPPPQPPPDAGEYTNESEEDEDWDSLGDYIDEIQPREDEGWQTSSDYIDEIQPRARHHAVPTVHVPSPPAAAGHKKAKREVQEERDGDKVVQQLLLKWTVDG